MDCKKLIDLLRKLDERCISDLCGKRILNCNDLCINRGAECIVYQAITAIETLLAERDAAIKCLRNAGCGYCKYQEFEFNKYPCIDCKSNGGKEDKWEFIGCNR